MIKLMIAATLIVLVCGQSRTFSVVNETFEYEYIFQRDYTGNYTDHVAFCRSLHNAELIKFNSTEEYEFIMAIAMTRGSFIIGLYIPANADYRQLTWSDDTPVDLDRVQMKFRFGLPAFSSSFRYFYTRSTSAELTTANYFGSAICKRKYVPPTTTSTSTTTTTTTVSISEATNSTVYSNSHKLSLSLLNQSIVLFFIFYNL